MMFGKTDGAVNLDRDMSELLRRPTIVQRIQASERHEVVQMRAAQSQRTTPLEHTAAWLRTLRYEDMMQLATEMHGIKAGDPIDTPEQLAKLLHSWAKATTEPTPETGQ
jgi:hypothetical protein